VRFPRTVAGPRYPSHEVGCSTECFERRGCKRIGFLAPTMTSLFPESLRGFHLDAVPRPLASPGSSSREHDLLFRVLPLRTCPHACVRDAFLGVSFPIATSAKRVHW